jgi:MerR family transcriptional regulator, heat shock protein HspR
MIQNPTLFNTSFTQYTVYNMHITDSEAIFSIGEAARRVGISASTLRLYEGEGMLCPVKTPTKRRTYSLNDLRLAQTVHNLIQDKGLNFAGVKKLMSFIPCWKINNCSAETLRVCEVPRYKEGPCWSSGESIRRECTEDCQICKVYNMAYKMDQFSIYDFIEGKNFNSER